MVPSGVWDLAPLVAALREHHADWSFSAVWCGDPHLRPVLDPVLGLVWGDVELGEPTGVGWARLIVALSTRAYEWSRTAAAVSRLLDTSVGVGDGDGDRGPAVVVLRVGSVAVLGDCSALVGGRAVTLVGRALMALPDDELSPSEADLISRGDCSDVVAAFRAGAQLALGWLGRQLLESSGEVGPWLQRLAVLFDVEVRNDPHIGVGAWRGTSGVTPALVDLDLLDRNEPWHFTIASEPSRVLLSGDPQLATAVRSGLAQVSGIQTPIRLPGGIVIDDAIRAVTRAALRETRTIDCPLPPEPFGAHNSAYLEWLESPYPWGAGVGRYWLEVREGRADLRAAFAQPQSVDARRYAEWAASSWRLEHHSMLLRPSSAAAHPVISVGFDPAGINVLGYLDFDQSLGDIAREIVAALEQAQVPVAALNHERTRAPRRSDSSVAGREALYATNVVVVTADQFEFVVSDHGQSLLDGRYNIGYWFWELEHVPASMLLALDHVQEIWTGSRFVAEAFARVTDKPVRCVPLPIPQPQPSERTRASFGLPADRFVFLTTFDQASVPERKNPLGVIDAFTRAFGDGEGPLLWIKTMNGHRHWQEHERLLSAAAGRSDIIVWDEHLSRADQMAVVRAADCLVSLHRSEGLGLPCAEAMWLNKPVIATRYSGNLDFMDDTCAAMIDYRLIPVRHGKGIYPDQAVWADPDLEQAAVWMRQLVESPALCTRLGSAARQRMASQPSLAEAGRTIARVAQLGSSRNISGGRQTWD